MALAKFGHCFWPANYKAQVGVGNVGCSISRTDQEKMPMESLALTNIVLGSEVRIVDSQANEFISGIEETVTTSLSWTYQAPVQPKIVMLNIIKPGYHVVSQEIVVGSGSQSIKIFQKVNGAYQNA